MLFEGVLEKVKTVLVCHLVDISAVQLIHIHTCNAYAERSLRQDSCSKY